MEKNARNIIILFDIKFNHKWNEIYEAIKNKILPTDDEYSNILKDFDTNKVITILDKEYPEIFRTINKPPFVLYKEDSEKIEDFIQVCKECNLDPTLLETRKWNNAILQGAKQEYDKTVIEERDELEKITKCITLLNEIRRDDI